MLKVADGHRVRIRRTELENLVTWLPSSAGAVETLLVLGAAGGLMVIPKGMLNSYVPDLEDLKARTFSLHDAAAPEVTVARMLALSWTATLRVSENRYNLQLPEEARVLGAAPNAGERVVLFAAGPPLEVWPYAAYLAEAQSAHKHLRRDWIRR